MWSARPWIIIRDCSITPELNTRGAGWEQPGLELWELEALTYEIAYSCNHPVDDYGCHAVRPGAINRGWRRRKKIGSVSRRCRAGRRPDSTRPYQFEQYKRIPRRRQSQRWPFHGRGYQVHDRPRSE